MGKSDDSISRRKNRKSLRKHENKVNSSSKVSTRVASIIAAKKRRQTGKRRMCQGMCFSLPTPEDPFNDRQEKLKSTRNKKRDSKGNKKLVNKDGNGSKQLSLNDGDAYLQERNLLEYKKAEKGKLELFSTIRFMGSEIAINIGKSATQIVKWDGSNYSWKEHGCESKVECPSKYLTMCLNSIQDAFLSSGSLCSEGDKPLFLFANAWGLEFWACYCSGKDVLETDGANSSIEQIAWLASTAADTISMKEKEGLSVNGPFLLYLVPSQDKATQVRNVCKPLKAHGIHTVSLHSGAAIDHQINGLKSCEPEFLVATPERLLELVSLKAIDISGISLLVIDGLEASFKGTYIDSIKSIRQFIHGNPRTVVFLGNANDSLAPL